MSRHDVSRRLVLVAFIALALSMPGGAEPRTWTDATGDFSVDAELVGVKDGKALLKSTDGKEIVVPLKRLSKADQDYLKQLEQSTGEPADQSAVNEIEEIADRFYADLRTEERTEAQAALTEKAAKLAEEGNSPLTGLPKPDEHRRAIRVGKIEIDGSTAAAPVRVRAGGQFHKTKLHFRNEDGAWRVFAISAEFPDGEKTLNFEVGASAAKEDPLLALIGQDLQVEGVTLGGQPVSLAQFEGKVVLIDFWATWCGPCRAEIPNILENYQTYHEAGFEVMAISVDRDLDALKQFVVEENPPWAVLADNHPRNKASVSARLGISGIPAFILVGPDGKVVTVHCRGKRLGQELEKLLPQSGKKVALAQ